MTVSAEVDGKPAAETAAIGFRRPQLLPGTELLGRFAGSGVREPPYLVRRRDGQVVQLSRLLYEIARRMDGRDVAAIADRAGRSLDLRITPEQVDYVAEHKLAPLGVVTYRDGSLAHFGRVDAVLALKFRAGVLPGRAVRTSVCPVTVWGKRPDGRRVAGFRGLAVPVGPRRRPQPSGPRLRATIPS